MSERIPLKVEGLSYSHSKSGAYALILGQVDGPIRIPVVIGPAEAQSIAMFMEKVTPPRPLTHDLFVGCNRAFGIRMKEVFISRFHNGVFSSEITFTDGERQVVMDSRTSDAVALAMRARVPIFTTREIMEETGFVMSIEEKRSEEQEDSDIGRIENHAPESPAASEPEPSLERYSIEELERTLARLVEQENYEEAQRVSEILKNKKNQSK
ncbi:MAG: bifunctional nuclease family protein [Muribaculaceae bacterium]|nr:bifunctional nuclease family protein [Muribaculaceae bacterium]